MSCRIEGSPSVRFGWRVILNVISQKARAPRGLMEAVGQLVGIALAAVLFAATHVLKAVLKPTSINGFAAVARLSSYLLAQKPRTEKANQATRYYGRDYSDFEPAITRCIQFPRIGYMLVWAYRSQGVVHAEVKLDNRRIEAVFGAKAFPLEPRSWSEDVPLEAIETELVDEAERVLVRRCQSRRSQAAPAKPVVAAKPQAQRAPAAPAEAVAKAPAEMVKPSQPSSAQGTIVGPRTALRSKTPPVRQTARAEVVDRSQGVLVNADTFERTLGDDTFRQFAVDVVLDAGVTKRIWGADLQRALQESKANLGDLVEVAYHGKTANWNDEDGGSRRTNHYSVRVIERA